MNDDDENEVIRLLHLDCFGKGCVDSKHIEKFLNSCKKNDFYDWSSIAFSGDIIIKSHVFTSKIIIKGRRDNNIILENITFEEGADFSGSNFAEVNFQGVKSSGLLSFNKCIFNENASINGDFDTVDYSFCVFKKVTTFSGLYSISALFTLCVFYETTRFVGVRNISFQLGAATELSSVSELSANLTLGEKDFYYYYFIMKTFVTKYVKKYYRELKKQILILIKALKNITNNVKKKHFIPKKSNVVVKRLFGGVADFNETDFVQPHKVFFNGVDLMKANFNGVNLKGIHFFDVNFYQSKLKRNGLLNEINLLESNDRESILYQLPRLESAYRNIRVSLEESKNFGVATDMYVGEMEAKRKQLTFLRKNFWSAEWLFKLVSNYGQSAAKASMVLLALIGLHLLITGYLFDQIGSRNLTLDDIDKTLRVISLQKVDREEESSLLGVIDTIFRVLVPVQAGMLGLALRTKIKRH